MTRARKPSAPGRRPRVPLPEPRARACRECKRQKIFCSKTLPKCERCQARSMECVYGAPKKIRVNEDKLRYLKAKLQRYEEIFQSLPPDVVKSIPGGLPLTAMPEGKEEDDEDSEGDDDDTESLPDQFKQMSIYLRASRGSADNFFQIASKLPGLRGGNGTDAAHDAGLTSSLEHIPVFYDPGMLPTHKPAKDLKIIALPPVDVARHYFFSQHMYIGTIFAFSSPETFEKQLDDAYERPLNLNDTRSCLTYAKILMILALGRLYSVNRGKVGNDHATGSDSYSNSSNNAQIDENDHPPGFVYFANALALLPDVHEPGSTLGVETLAYVGYFLQNMNRRDAAFLYIGLALRMAISLGLHQELPATSLSVSVSEAEREHRRRVWWSIYSLDRILSLKSGHPVSILDEDIGVNMPSPQPGEAANSPVVVLRCYTELSRILGEITALIYRRSGSHTGSSLIATVHSILQSLIQWEEALPRTLRLNSSSGSTSHANASAKLSREGISMYLHYYQCINMVARPLLFHIVQRRLAAPADKEKDWQAGLSDKTVAVIRACISAAHNTVQFMTKAAQHNMVATYGYMDGEHAYSAAIVLALVCAAFPSEATTVDAMEKGLALLQRMGDLGNSYVAARYQQLVRLSTLFGEPAESDASVSEMAERTDAAAEAPPRPPESVDAAHLHTTFIADNLDHLYLPQQLPQASADFDSQAFLSLDLDLDMSLDRDLNLAAMETSGLLFMDPRNGFVEAPGVAPTAPANEDGNVSTNSGESGRPVGDVETDNAMWTTAFSNSVNFDITQLMLADAGNYFMTG